MDLGFREGLHHRVSLFEYPQNVSDIVAKNISELLANESLGDRAWSHSIQCTDGDLPRPESTRKFAGCVCP